MIAIQSNTYIADYLLSFDLKLIISTSFIHILKGKRKTTSLVLASQLLVVNPEEFCGCEPTTDLRISSVNPVQPKQPVWRSVTCVEVVLHHFGCPLSRVVIRVELSSGHHQLPRLLFPQVWRLKAQRAG